MTASGVSAAGLDVNFGKVNKFMKILEIVSNNQMLFDHKFEPNIAYPKCPNKWWWYLDSKGAPMVVSCVLTYMIDSYHCTFEAWTNTFSSYGANGWMDKSETDIPEVKIEWMSVLFINLWKMIRLCNALHRLFS